MILLIILFFPLLTAALTYFVGNKNLAGKVALGLALVELFGTCFLYPELQNTKNVGLSFTKIWVEKFHINFALSLDGLSFLMLALTNFLIPIILFSSLQKAIKNSNVFYGLVLMMQFALNGVFLASDGFLFYIFWELALLPIFFIAWLWGEGEEEHLRNKAVFKFFLYTLVGSLFMLVGILFLYVKSGSFALQDWYKLNLTDKEQCTVFLALFIAFAIKIPIFPFHTWQPNTYKEAPTVGSMLLAGIMLKMGLYGVLRWLLPVVPHGFICWTPWVIALSTIGIVYGSVIAIMQKDLKRLIAYSSMAHVGLIAAGIFSLTNEGLAGSIIQMLAHGVNVVGLFFAGEIIFRRTGTYQISKLGGIRMVAPKFAAVFLIVVLASVALPGTNSFVGEFLLLFGVFSYNSILVIFAGLTIILGAVYMLKMYQDVMLGSGHSNHTFADLNFSEMLTFAPLLMAIFVFGIYPKPILDLIHPVVENIIQLAAR